MLYTKCESSSQKKVSKLDMWDATKTKEGIYKSASYKCIVLGASQTSRIVIFVGPGSIETADKSTSPDYELAPKASLCLEIKD